MINKYKPTVNKPEKLGWSLKKIYDELAVAGIDNPLDIIKADMEQIKVTREKIETELDSIYNTFMKQINENRVPVCSFRGDAFITKWILACHDEEVDGVGHYTNASHLDLWDDFVSHLKQNGIKMDFVMEDKDTVHFYGAPDMDSLNEIKYRNIDEGGHQYNG